MLLAIAAALTLQAQLAAQLTTYTFGSDEKTFTMDFVTIGNPGNDPDTSPAGWGVVATVYLMSKYEVSEDMIAKANAVGSLGITRYTLGVNKPARWVSWNEAARVVNWLNVSEGYSAAYKFTLQPGDVGYDANADILLWTAGDAGYNAANPYRNSLARFFLPSENEWYKAAYYDPVGSLYYDYPTGSDSAPSAVASGTTDGTAVYNQLLAQGPADIANAGGLSPYGTMGQGGNASEWMESAFDGSNDSGSENRAWRGGDWEVADWGLKSSTRGDFTRFDRSDFIGFRVAAVPEPLESGGMIGLAALGFALWRRRGSL